MASILLFTAYGIGHGIKGLKEKRKQRKMEKEGLYVEDTGVQYSTKHPATHSPHRDQPHQQDHQNDQDRKEHSPHAKKTQQDLDNELMEKMANRSGDAAGLQFEDGRPVSMKRGVRENMFRYI